MRSRLFPLRDFFSRFQAKPFIFEVIFIDFSFLFEYNKHSYICRDGRVVDCGGLENR